MAELTVINRAGEAVGAVEVPDVIFGQEVRRDLVHAAMLAQLAAKRTGTHKAKTRGEVSGGGRKPYRQKGTGRARHGSSTSPIWKGGGVIFPPTPRDYSQQMPRKQRRKALFCAWSEHAAQGTLVVLDEAELAEPRTRLADELWRGVVAPRAATAAEAVEPPAPREDGPPARRKKGRQRVLVVTGPGDEVLRQASANIKELVYRLGEKITIVCPLLKASAPYASVWDLVTADQVVVTRAALERIIAEFTAEEAGEEAVA